MSDTNPSWTLVVNADAGSTDREFIGRAAVVLAEHAPVEVAWSHDPHDVVEVASDRPDTTIVLVGGDGTLSRSVNVLIESGFGDRPLGMLPGGTGNDFLRGHDVPLDPDGAAAVLLDASPQPMSALRVMDRFAINALHIGLGAAASRRAAGYKDRLGPLAYPVGGVIEGVRHRGHHLSIAVDGEALDDTDVLMSAIVVGRTIGGGTELSRRTATRATSADLLVFRDDGLRGRIGLARGMLGDAPAPGPNLVVDAVRHVEFSSTDGFPVNLDGEDLGDERRLEVTLSENAWTALLPADESGDDAASGREEGL